MSNISNDSGLDDSANAVVANPAAAATRLSWFLAEVDEGCLKQGQPNGSRQLCVLHSMELLESDVSDKYMTRIVKFRLEGKQVEAKLILAADERKLVDAALLSMSKEQRDYEHDKQLLVQYTEDETSACGPRLVQKLMSAQRVVWLSSNPELGGTPVIKVAPGCLGHMLYTHEGRDHMEKMLLHLKARCFDQAFDEQLDAAQQQQGLDEQSWLLVQYSPEPETVVYQVIQYSQTVWRQENLFKDVIAYVQLPGSEVVLQAVVIGFGEKQQMLAKHEKLREFALNLDFPKAEELEQQLLQGSGTAALFARTSSTIFQRAEQRDANGEHKQLRRSLEQMSEKAQSEADMIIEAFDMVDNINRNLQCHMSDV
ncbi:CG15634 [Drosophila busckii]|uniref:CG15634 n=1 Tax=Drosophila busckii TaxID=30019 RepID=A0A0M4EAA7_DROBS|nr:early boundary activity protein 3 [Drosophila busckii]XP_017835169.1 early boundary activity protein 3 [Drosophila busckii]XP_017835170.1 early boundary activity protein 3 [Drosophila busckii]XP_017835171.1 early boundary activity protein 3 [Drosophila busckii]ALC38122.1 CG15634 [Drosophila busckii]